MESEEIVAELVHNFLLPETLKQTARERGMYNELIKILAAQRTTSAHLSIHKYL